MAPTAFEKAVQDRDLLIENLEYLDSKITAHAVTPLLEFEIERHLKRAATVEDLVNSNYNTLVHAAPKGTDLTPYKEKSIEMTDKAVRIHAGLHGIKSSFPVKVDQPPTQSQTTKLPPLELPKFSGNLQEWIPFRDLFLNTVHNSSIPKIEKLAQLRSLLTGEASRQIKSLILSDANYDIAWTTLTERYENNRELMFSLFRRLFTQNQMQPNSATSLRGLIDTTKECVRSLEVLQMPTQHWDPILIYFVSNKLDSSTRELWEQSLPDTSIPKLSKLFDFLEQRARALAASTGSNNRSQTFNHEPKRTVSSHHVSTTNCKLGCSDYHYLFKCPVFRKYSCQERKNFLSENHHCYNCLNPGHTTDNCKSNLLCMVCNQKHHTLIHIDEFSSPEAPPHQDEHTFSTYATMQLDEVESSVLATARVVVPDQWGNNQNARAFFDSGSSVDFVTERLVQKLKLPCNDMSASVVGLSGQSVGKVNKTVELTIKPHFSSDVSYTITALVVKKITGSLPQRPLDISKLHHCHHLHLADPEFNRPAPVDILIGSNIFWDSLLGGKVKGDIGQPIATNTVFGWIIAGKSWRTPEPPAILSFHTKPKKLARKPEPTTTTTTATPAQPNSTATTVPVYHCVTAAASTQSTSCSSFLNSTTGPATVDTTSTANDTTVPQSTASTTAPAVSSAVTVSTTTVQQSASNLPPHLTPPRKSLFLKFFRRLPRTSSTETGD